MLAVWIPSIVGDENMIAMHVVDANVSLAQQIFPRLEMQTLIDSKYNSTVWQPSSLLMLRADVFVLVNSRMHVVQVVDSKFGLVTLLAGKYGQPGTVDSGDGLEAQFQVPFSVAAPAVNPPPYLVIAQSGGACLRRIDTEPPFAVSTFVCGDLEDLNNPLGDPKDVVVMLNGDMFIANGIYNNIVFYSQALNILEVFAGSMDNEAGFVDGFGLQHALFDGPLSIAYFDGLLYVSDTGNHALRTITTSYKNASAISRMVRTLVGSRSSSDGKGAFGYIDGSFLEARLQNPKSIRFMRRRYLIVADSGNQAIRFLDMLSNRMYTLFATGVSTNFTGSYLLDRQVSAIWAMDVSADGETLVFAEVDTNSIVVVCLDGCNKTIGEILPSQWIFEKAEEIPKISSDTAPADAEVFLEDILFHSASTTSQESMLLSTTPQNTMIAHIAATSTAATTMFLPTTTTPAPSRYFIRPLSIGDPLYTPPVQTIFVEYENRTINASDIPSHEALRVVGDTIRTAELCCNFNEFYRLVPPHDPMLQLPMAYDRNSFNKPMTNYSLLTAVLRNVDGTDTIVTRQVARTYNISFAIVGNNSIGAVLDGKNILHVSAAGSIHLRMSFIGFKDSSRSTLIRFESEIITIKAVQTLDMMVTAHTLFQEEDSIVAQSALQEQALKMQPFVVHSIQCSEILFEMIQVHVLFQDTEGVFHRVHTSAYHQVNVHGFVLELDNSDHAQSSLEKSAVDASVYYGVSTGSSTIAATWENPVTNQTFHAYMTLEVSSMDPLLLEASSMQNVSMQNTVLAGQFNTVFSNMREHMIETVFATRNREPVQFLHARLWTKHHAQPWLFMKELLAITSSDVSTIQVDASNTNALILMGNTILPVAVHVEPKMIPTHNAGEALCSFSSASTDMLTKKILHVQGNLVLQSNGDFDMGVTDRGSQPVPVMYGSKRNASEASTFVLPIYTRVMQNASSATGGLFLKALDMGIIFDTAKLKVVSCFKGESAPNFFACSTQASLDAQTGQSVGVVRIAALDTASIQAGQQMHIASVVFQTSNTFQSGTAFLEGRRFAFYTEPDGNVPCTVQLQENFIGNLPKHYCPFLAGGKLAVSVVAEADTESTPLFNNAQQIQARRSMPILNAVPISNAMLRSNMQTGSTKGVPHSANTMENNWLFTKQQMKEAARTWRAKVAQHHMKTSRKFGMLSANALDKYTWKNRKLLQHNLIQTLNSSEQYVQWTATNYEQSMAFLFPTFGYKHGDIPGDVDQDAEFNIIDVLMCQQFHLHPSMSTLGIPNTEWSLSRDALTLRNKQHLYPIGSDNGAREFLHLLYALSGSQLFVTQVQAVIANISQTHFKLAITVHQPNAVMDSKIRVTIVLKTRQWWMFHRMLNKTNNMYYDMVNHLLFIEAVPQSHQTVSSSTQIITDRQWTIEAPSVAVSLLSSFPLSVDYLHAWNHMYNYMQEDHPIQIAFVVETHVDDQGSHTTLVSALQKRNPAHTSAHPQETLHDTIAQYINVSLTSASQRRIVQSYAHVDLSTAPDVCSIYRNWIHHSNAAYSNHHEEENSNSIETDLYTYFENCQGQASYTQAQCSSSLTEVVVHNGSSFSKVSHNLLEPVYEAKIFFLVHAVLETELTAGTEWTQEFMDGIQATLPTMEQSMLYWDTWIFLPLQCHASSANLHAKPVYLLTTNATSRQEILLSSNTSVPLVTNSTVYSISWKFAVEVGFHAGVSFEQARQLLVSVEKDHLHAVKQKMMYSFHALFSQVPAPSEMIKRWRLSDLQMQVTSWKILLHTPSSMTQNDVDKLQGIGLPENIRTIPLPEPPTFSAGNSQKYRDGGFFVCTIAVFMPIISCLLIELALIQFY
jgi:hypothetical protein